MVALEKNKKETALDNSEKLASITRNIAYPIVSKANKTMSISSIIIESEIEKSCKGFKNNKRKNIPSELWIG